MNYQSLAKTTAKVIADFGQLVTLTQKSGGVYDPETGEVGGMVETASEFKAVIGSVKYREIDGTNILSGDKRLTVAGTVAILPKVGDVIMIGDEPHTVTQIGKTAPGGVVVSINILCRTGA